MAFTVVYLKVRSSKNGDVAFEGPLVSKKYKTKSDAEDEARIIVSSSKMAIIPRIYEVDDDKDQESIISMVADHFERMKKNIIESKEITDRPIKRSRRKKLPCL